MLSVMLDDILFKIMCNTLNGANKFGKILSDLQVDKFWWIVVPVPGRVFQAPGAAVARISCAVLG